MSKGKDFSGTQAGIKTVIIPEDKRIRRNTGKMQGNEVCAVVNDTVLLTALKNFNFQKAACCYAKITVVLAVTDIM